MIPQELKNILTSNTQVMSGAVCFSGTRVPVQALLDTLDGGESVRDFLGGFPDVTPQQALAVVHWEQTQARHSFGIETVE